MAFVEEWRGCRDYDGSAVTLDRRPCYTEPRDGDRTDGQYQELMTIFEGIDLEQGGDATLAAARGDSDAGFHRARSHRRRRWPRWVFVRLRSAIGTRILTAQMYSLDRARRLRTLACQHQNGLRRIPTVRGLEGSVRTTATGVRPLPDGSFTPGACVRTRRGARSASVYHSGYLGRPSREFSAALGIRHVCRTPCLLLASLVAVSLSPSSSLCSLPRRPPCRLRGRQCSSRSSRRSTRPWTSSSAILRFSRIT